MRILEAFHSLRSSSSSSSPTHLVLVCAVREQRLRSEAQCAADRPAALWQELQKHGETSPFVLDSHTEALANELTLSQQVVSDSFLQYKVWKLQERRQIPHHLEKDYFHGSTSFCMKTSGGMEEWTRGCRLWPCDPRASIQSPKVALPC